MAPIILAEATSTLINKFRRWGGSAHTQKKCYEQQAKSNKRQAKNNKQLAKSNQQREKSNEQKVTFFGKIKFDRTL